MSIICADFIKPITHKPFKVGTYVDFGPPSISNTPIGTLYFDKHTNKTWMLNSQRKWVHMITPLMWAEYGISSTEAIQVFDSLGKAIAAWEMPSQINKVVTEKEFIRSGRGIPPEKGEEKRVNGEIYYTVDTNQIVIKSDDNLIELAPGKVYDFPKVHNCCNCGAPVKGHRCEYCGTQY